MDSYGHKGVFLVLVLQATGWAGVWASGFGLGFCLFNLSHGFVWNLFTHKIDAFMKFLSKYFLFTHRVDFFFFYNVDSGSFLGFIVLCKSFKLFIFFILFFLHFAFKEPILMFECSPGLLIIYLSWTLPAFLTHFYFNSYTWWPCQHIGLCVKKSNGLKVSGFLKH